MIPPMRRFLTPLCLLALATVSFGQKLSIEKYSLPNGLTVILNEDHRLPSVSVNLWYKVGSKDEAEHRSGFAHLFEHLMFMGTKRAPNGEFDRVMEAEGGSNNASTWFDRTNYFEAGPSKLLPVFLWLEADRMQDLGKSMTQEKLNLQRDVVRNERRQSVENVPYGEPETKINELMYPERHPYHIDVIGKHEDLEAATVNDVKDFFATYYVPNNCSLVISGDFQSAEAKSLVAKYFNGLPRKDDPIHRDASAASLPGVKRVTLTDKVPAPRVYMVWHSPQAYSAGDADLNVASGILGSGVASRLYQALVVEAGLATDVSAGQTSLLLGSLFQVQITAKPGADLAKVEAVANLALEKFRNDGPLQDEVDRQTAQIKTQLAHAIESVNERSDKLNSYEFYFGDPDGFSRELALYRAVTPTSIKATAQQVMDPAHKLVMQVVPRQEEAKVDTLDQKPTLLAAHDPSFPTAETFKLSNGAEVYFYPRGDVPLVEAKFIFDAPALAESAEERGKMSLLAGMLVRGAGDMDAVAFSAATDRLGASIDATANQFGFVVTASSLTENFVKTLGLADLMMRKPRFDKEEWGRLSAEEMAGIKKAESTPTAVADRTLLGQVFTPSSYSVANSGSSKTLKNITFDAVKAAAAKLNPAKAKIVVTGNIDKEALKNQLNSLFATLPAGAGQSAPAAQMQAQQDINFVMVDAPGATQTSIRWAFPQGNVASPERLSLQAVSTILGGSFTSRLNQNLREKNGYTYGAAVRFDLQPTYGLATVTTNVRTEVTGASLKEIIAELNKIGTGDISETEAKKAIALQRNNLVERLGTLNAVSTAFMVSVLKGQPANQDALDYAALGSLSAAQINSAAKAMFPRAKSVLVLVGDKAKIASQLAGLGLPEPKLIGKIEPGQEN